MEKMKKIIILSLILVLSMFLCGCISTHPTAKFSMDISEGPAPLTVQFRDMSQDNSVKGITNRQWIFYEGSEKNYATEKNPSYTFRYVGTHKVTLWVWDEDQNQDTVTKYVTVTSGYTPTTPTNHPIASFEMDIENGTAPLTVHFNSNGSYDPDGGDIVNYSWDFKDGGTSNIANPTHTFEQDGTYYVKLTVTNNEGETYWQEHLITVGGSRSTNSSIIFASSDAYVSQNNPDNHYGLQTFLQVSGDDYIYLKFTEIPAIETIISAKLKLYTTYELTNGPEIVVYSCSDTTWVEDDITWNTKPLYSGYVVDRIIVNGSQDWFTWDIWNKTNNIKEAVNDSSLTLVLVGSTSQVARFFSIESGTIYTAKIELQIES